MVMADSRVDMRLLQPLLSSLLMGSGYSPSPWAMGGYPGYGTPAYYSPPVPGYGSSLAAGYGPASMSGYGSPAYSLPPMPGYGPDPFWFGASAAPAPMPASWMAPFVSPDLLAWLAASPSVDSPGTAPAAAPVASASSPARRAPVQAASAPAPVATAALPVASTARASAVSATASDSLTRPGDVPSQMGVHVHVKDLYGANNLINTRDLDMMQAAGVKTVRMDALWSDIEKTPGVYDFSRYDAVVQELEKRGIKPLIILGFGNQHYPQEQRASMAAFERYATATAQHFSNRGVIWELTNEPNSGQFWKPGPSPTEYMTMVKSLAPKLRAADPSGQIIAGSTAGTDTDFLVKLFDQGLLNYVDAVSVHPYQAFPNREPEQVKAELDKLRRAVDQYAPGRDFPIVLGEWGYSTAQGELSASTQADYLVRQSLLAQLHGSPLNIWYDWKGDIEGRTGAASKEEQFGIVSGDLQPKPAYAAMQRMHQQLAGLHFSQRLKTDSPNDYVLLFTDGANRSTLVSWTTDPAHRLTLGGQSLALSGTPGYQAFDTAFAQFQQNQWLAQGATSA